MLGNRYNPNQDEALQKEIESGLSRMLAIRFDIEHLTGKEAIELVRQHQKPKFIITMDGVFRLGMVNQHKHLLKPGDQCIGGGYYHFDFVSNRIILDRESYDFGRPKWHLLEVLKVPSTYRGMRIIYKYDDGFHDDFNVSEELKIEYYD